MNKKQIQLILAMLLTVAFAPISRAQSIATAPAVSGKSQLRGVATQVTNASKKTTIAPSHRKPGTSPGIVHPKASISTKVKPNLHTHQALFNHKAGVTPIKTHLHTHQNLFNYKNKVKTASTGAKTPAASATNSVSSSTTSAAGTPSPKN